MWSSKCFKCRRTICIKTKFNRYWLVNTGQPTHSLRARAREREVRCCHAQQNTSMASQKNVDCTSSLISVIVILLFCHILGFLTLGCPFQKTELIACNSTSIATSLALTPRHTHTEWETFLNQRSIAEFFQTGARRQQSTLRIIMVCCCCCCCSKRHISLLYQHWRR